MFPRFARAVLRLGPIGFESHSRMVLGWEQAQVQLGPQYQGPDIDMSDFEPCLHPHEYGASKASAKRLTDLGLCSGPRHNVT